MDRLEVEAILDEPELATDEQVSALCRALLKAWTELAAILQARTEREH